MINELTVSHDKLMCFDTKLNSFALKVFKVLYDEDKFVALTPHFVKCNPKYKIEVSKTNASLKGVLMETDFAGIKEANSKTVKGVPYTRWYEYPFAVGSKTYFLSNQWSEDGNKSNPTYKELKGILSFCYPKYRLVYTGGKFSMYMKDTFSNSIAQEIETEKVTNKSFDISALISSIKSTNLIYSDTLIKRFAYSLLTKPFVILSGLAGSGKTQLALACAKALVEDVDKQICFVSVGADWTNREPLLGFPNALKDGVYQTPESGALQLMLEAEENPTKPYFLILDEMNLSYVERYFADFLSAMEAKGMRIKLWDGDDGVVHSTVSLPQNLFIVGTINVDETTYMFSPKVLDRANVIEFKVSDKDMEEFLDMAPNVDITLCEAKAADMAESFVEIAGGSKIVSTEANDVLKKFFKELKTVNAEFGYRTATEIGCFISLATENDSMSLDDAVDAAIVQKLLPKLHGSRKKIVKVLEPLFTVCCGKKIAELEEKDYEEVLDKATYPLSADKILRMYNSAIENGFTSFAEA